MGFSLRNFLNDAVATVNPFDNGQSAATNQRLRQQQQQSRPSAAFTPAPGSVQVSQQPAPVITHPNIVPAFNPNSLMTNNGGLPSILQPQNNTVVAPVVPPTATKVYKDPASGNPTGWEDATGSHLTPLGQEQQAASIKAATAPPAPPKDTRSLGSKLWDQINPVDSDRSFNNATPSKEAQDESLIHQITHAGAVNAAGSLVNNFTGIPTLIDTGRLGVDEFNQHILGKTNQGAIDRATESLSKNLDRFLPISAADSLKNGFLQDVATAATTPFAENSAKNAADQYRKMNPATGDPVHDSQVEANASAIEGGLLNEHLGTAGIDMNTPTGTVVRKVGAHGASAAANIIFASQVGNGAVEKFLPGMATTDAATTAAATATNAAAPTAADELLNNAKDSLLKKTLITSAKAGTANAAAGVADVAGTNDPTSKDYIKAGVGGFASGAAFPLVFEGLAQTPKLIEYGKTHAPEIKPVYADETPMPDKTPATNDVTPPQQPTKPTVSAPTPTAAKKTGVVDKQLKQIQDSKKSVIDTATDELMQGQNARPDIHQLVRQAGGISSSDHEGLPSVLKNKNGLPMDEMAANLGFKSDQELMDAISNRQAPLTKAQARDQVTQQLESGQHPYSEDYAQMSDAEKARQDELAALYPKGTRSQVKVTDNAPGKMSDAELQSLAQQPEAQTRPAGNKVVPVDDKNVIRNSDAERQVIDSLNKGAHSDQVLNDYMKATGTTLQQAVKDVNRVAKEANIETGLGKNPLEGSVKLPTVGEGDWRQATLNARHVQYKEQEVGSNALEAYKALSPKDQVLLKQIEGDTVSNVAKKADNPEAFKAANDALRTYFDTRHAYDTHLGIDVGYRTNYIRHFFDKAAEAETPPTGDEQLRGGGANKTPGYTKSRTVEALAKNVGDALERDIQSSSFNHAKLAYENGLNEAFPGKIANGEIPRSSNAGKYQQIDHPFGNDLSAPKDIAHDINSRVWHPNDSKALDRFDAVNRGLKYVKLSGGLFHAFTESGNFLGQQLSSGKLFTDPVATGKLVKIFFSDGAMRHEVARMAEPDSATGVSVLDKAHLSGLTIRSDQILADANIKGLDKSDPNALKGAAEKTAKYTGVQAMHDATFQREIPYAKLKIFEQKTAGLDPMKPEDLQIMRKQAESINNLFGGINREIHGITPGTFKWLQRGLLATDFTEGKFKTLANALTDTGRAGTTARQAVAGKALLFAIVATAGAAAGGNYQGKSKGQIVKDAAGNLIDPTFEMGGYKVGLPKTHISEVVDALKPTQNNGKAWNASGLLSYAQNRTAALPSEAISLLSNKNYYGQPLYGTNTKKNGGGKISAPQAGLNIAQTVLPIPFGQATNTVTGKQSPAAAVANIVGFKAKPNPDNTVSFDGVNTTMNDKQTEQYQTALKTNQDKITKQLTDSANFQALSPNDQSKALSELKSNITSATQRDFASKNNLGQFAPDYKKAGTEASAKEQDILSGKINPDAYTPGASKAGTDDSYAVSQFKKSNAKTTQIGNDTYYKKSDGTVAHTSTFDYQATRDSSKNKLSLEQAKTSGDYGSWQTAAVKQIQLLQKQADHYDPVTESDKIDALQVQADSLISDLQKYKSYGDSFTKPRAGRKGRSSNGISYKFFDPTSYEKSLRSILDAARVG